MSAQAQIPLLSGQMVQLHEADLDLLMPVISEFPLRSQCRLDAYSQLPGSIQYLLISDSLIISRSCLHKMTGAVKLMTVDQTSELPIRFLNGKISSQISIRLLRLCYEIHYAVRHLFQGFIRLFHERVGNSFQPFVDITVLKHPSIMAAGVNAGCDPEILQRMALLIRYG